MKDLVLFGIDGVPGREWGVIVKDETFKGGAKIVDLYGAKWAISEVVIEPRLTGKDRLDWHWDAISRGGASLWDCICGDIESFIWRFKIYRRIVKHLK